MDVEGPSGRQALQSVYTNPFGAQRTVVLLVNFASNPVQPYTTATARNTVFTTTSNWDLESWYPADLADGRRLRLVHDRSVPDRLATTARWPARREVGGNGGRRQPVELLSTTSTPSRGMWLFMVGTRFRRRGTPRSAWINGSLRASRSSRTRWGTTSASTTPTRWDCGAVVPGPTCTMTEYGDVLDIDGEQTRTTSTRFRRSGSGGLAYGSSPPIKTVTSSGTYTIDPYESLRNSSEGAEDSRGRDRLLFLRRGEARPWVRRRPRGQRERLERCRDPLGEPQLRR